MEKSFDYFYTRQAQDSIDIADIGNCALSAFTDLGRHYMLIIKTENGQTKTLQFGPIIVGTNETFGFCSCTFNQFEYNEKQIVKMIEKFVSIKDITQVIEEDEESLYDKMVDLRDYVR